MDLGHEVKETETDNPFWLQGESFIKSLGLSTAIIGYQLSCNFFGNVLFHHGLLLDDVNVNIA